MYLRLLSDRHQKEKGDYRNFKSKIKFAMDNGHDTRFVLDPLHRKFAIKFFNFQKPEIG